jgi:hypothetical protein
MLRQFSRLMLILLLVVLPLQACGDDNQPSSEQQSASCDTRENGGEIAQDFIGRCCLGSIYREFPSEYLSSTLEEIRRDSSATGRKAWKLLNDGRFRK